MTTRAEALAIVRRLAVDIQEPTEAEAVARLLERVANGEPELRAALVEVGALAILQNLIPLDDGKRVVLECRWCQGPMEFVGWHCRYCCYRRGKGWWPR